MLDNESIDKLREGIDHSNNIVVITGAGISVPSGIPDFRSATGIYKTTKGIGRSPEYMLSHTCFIREPEEFYKFYKDKIVHRDARPNLAHEYLAKLERMGKLKAIITQNIDGLHEEAGSKNVITFHGTIYRNYCTRCHKFFDLDYVMSQEGVPHCDKCGGIVKPDVVLYEEGLDPSNIDGSIRAIQHADMLIVIGTSLVVYPAAGLIDYYSGDNLVLINKGSTSYDSKASLVINSDIIDVVKALSE